MTAGVRAPGDLGSIDDHARCRAAHAHLWQQAVAAINDLAALDDLPDFDANRVVAPAKVRALPLSPGDALVIVLPFDRLSLAEAHDIRQHVRRELCRPDLPVLVFPAGTAVSVLSPKEPT